MAVVQDFQNYTLQDAIYLKNHLELSGEVIRKSDIALPKTKTSQTRSFRGNILFPSFLILLLKLVRGAQSRGKHQPLESRDQETDRVGQFG